MSSIPEEHRKIALGILFCPAEERTARELKQLPKEDRQQVWADMTGENSNIEYRLNAESPEFLFERIQALHHALEQHSHSNHSTSNATMLIPSPNRTAYEEAMEQDSAYVDRQKIKFLRADNFEVNAAALRIMRHFQLKKELFGKAKIARDIRLDDLSPDDLESLYGGGMQLLKLPDHAGRPVILTRAKNYVYQEHNNMLRSFWYVTQCVLNIQQAQQLGAVSVSYQVGGYPKNGYDFELTRKVSQFVKSTPSRIVSIYLCYDSSPWQRVADLISHLVSPILRVRLRSVQGSHQESVYKLMLLGIPHQCFPITDEGVSDLSYHHKWIKERAKIENAANSFLAM